MCICIVIYGFCAILVVVYFIVKGLRKFKNKDDFYDFRHTYVIVALFGILPVFTYVHIFNIAATANKYLEKEDVVEIGESIYSLSAQPESDIKGSFVLGCGNVSSNTDVTYYYYVDGEYGKTIQKLRNGMMTKVYIEESDEVEPCVKYIYTRSYTRDDAPEYVKREDFKSLKAKVIVVPKNTIQIEYNANI